MACQLTVKSFTFLLFCSISLGKSMLLLPEDLTTVTFAHGVNSISALNDSLEDTTIMILEADISLGFVEGSSILEPIMAHPPAIVSDLSFNMFMDRVLSFNSDQPEAQMKKGMKLDIKNVLAVEPVLKVLVDHGAAEFDFPVWINSDILRGPINSTGIPVNGKTFLNLTKTYLPEVTLSVGWTTRYDENTSNGSYTLEHVNEMLDLPKSENISSATPITYPVRAGIAAQSIESLLFLVNTSQEYWPISTLTIWSGGSDPVDHDLLRELISTVGKNRCYVDLPFEFEP